MDILVLLVVVVLIFQRLWKVLGTADEDSVHKIKLSREGAEKLYNLLKNETEKELQQAAENAGVLTPVDDKELSELDRTLRKIPDFSRESFIKGAKKAFEMITSAFNKADSATLKVLTAADIAKKMGEVIKQRKDDKISAETDFIGFDKADIIKAEIKEGKAYVTVEFVSEQVNVLRSESGEVIQGDENYIQNITDVWTFERPLEAKKSNWVLVSTKK